MNDTPFTYISCHGTKFVSTRCDFRTGIKVSSPASKPEWYISDIAEMIGYHATNIHPELNGFQGYDCIQWKIKK